MTDLAGSAPPRPAPSRLPHWLAPPLPLHKGRRPPHRAQESGHARPSPPPRSADAAPASSPPLCASRPRRAGRRGEARLPAKAPHPRRATPPAPRGGTTSLPAPSVPRYFLPRTRRCAARTAWRRRRAPEELGVRRPGQASARPTRSRSGRSLPPGAPPWRSLRRPDVRCHSSSRVRGGRASPARCCAAAAHRPCLLPAELYFLIARYLSAGPCRRAAQVSAGRAGGRASEPANRGRAGQPAGSDRASSLPQVLVQELEQYQVGPPPPGPRVPASPSRPASRPRWSHGRLSCLFPAVAEEVGLGGQRAQQELRGTGEQLPRPPRARAPSWLSAPVRASRGRARGDPRWPGASG